MVFITRIGLTALAAASALAIAAPIGAKTMPRLYGSVGPGLTISLKDASGKTVKSLRPGRYVFTIKDLSKQCNFHLLGPGVNDKTSVSKLENASWLVGMG